MARAWRRIAVVVVTSILCTAVVYGIASASSDDGNRSTAPVQRPTRLDTRPATRVDQHVPSSVDGRLWSVQTFRNAADELCLFLLMPEGDKSGTCYANQDLSEAGPILVRAGARQNPGNRSSWNSVWVWGLTSPEVKSLTLVRSDCTRVPVRLDRDHVFLHVVPIAQVDSGIAPYRLIAVNDAEEVLGNVLVKLGRPPQDGKPTGVTAAPQCR